MTLNLKDQELKKKFIPLIEEVEKLKRLLDKPEPGLASWQCMMADRLTAIRREVDKFIK
jgi:hypothetical protein